MEWSELISQVGFPIFVAVYFMYRMETVIKDYTQANKELTIAIKELVVNCRAHGPAG